MKPVKRFVVLLAVIAMGACGVDHPVTPAPTQTTPSTPTPAPTTSNPSPVAVTPAPVTAPTVPAVASNASTGVWATLPYTMPVNPQTTYSSVTLNPIHAILMQTGNVLFVQGSGNCPSTLSGCPQKAADYAAGIWDRTAGAISIMTNYTNWDMFCNGSVPLANGQILIDGGTLSYAMGDQAAVMRAMGMAARLKPGAICAPKGTAITTTATNASESTAGHVGRRVAANISATADGTFLGTPNAAIFNPLTSTFTNIQAMGSSPELGRWYPSAVALADGRALVFGGQDYQGNDNNTVEYYTSGQGWSPEYPAQCATSGNTTHAPDNEGGGCDPADTTGAWNQWYPQLYPRMFQLPNGKVVSVGPEPQTSVLNTTTNLWAYDVANMNYPNIRTYGSAVLMPLTPANNYDPKIIYFGGDDPATNTTEIIDFGSQNPAWTWGPAMSLPRIEMDAVLLPDGKILAEGGSANDEDNATASLAADIYDPATNTITSAGTATWPRLYHSVALLLPDATVMTAGGNPTQGTSENHVEIYEPAYLFNADGTLATRPVITAAPPSITSGAGTFTVNTNSTSIASVVIIRNGASTHAFDMSQREIGLAFTQSGTTLTCTAPPNASIATPGYYMLFVLNSKGVPSVATFVQVN